MTSKTHHSAPLLRFQAGVPIRTTALPDHGLTIVTMKLDDPNLLRRFATVTLDDATGEAIAIASFITQSAAMLAHDVILRERR